MNLRFGLKKESVVINYKRIFLCRKILRKREYFILFSLLVFFNIFLILLEELYILWLLRYSDVILVNILKFNICVFLFVLFIRVVR